METKKETYQSIEDLMAVKEETCQNIENNNSDSKKTEENKTNNELEKRIEKEKKFNTRWKNRRNRIIGTLCLILGIFVTLGTLVGVGFNFIKLDFIGVDVGGPKVQYTYDKFQDMHIDFEDIYNQEAYQYLVYFYADNCPHCHEIEQTVCKYAYDGPVAVYFVEASDYTKPELLMDGKYLTDNEEEARNSVGSTSLSGFKFYAFPSMYFFKSEGEATSPTTSGPKTLMGVYIGSNEIPDILEANS